MRYEELNKAKDFVGQFYDPEEQTYQLLTADKSRGGGGPILNRKEKLFLIIVANTLDPSIGVTTQKDAENITYEFTSLAAQMGIRQVFLTRILGEQFSKKAVDDALNGLRPGSNDIVIFYYSGHGFRYTKDTSQYCRISLRKNKKLKLERNNLRIEQDVYARILKKGPRVALVLADCCNEDIGAEPSIGRPILKPRGGPGLIAPFNMAHANALFFPASPLAIIVGSADRNQLASGNPNMGGFFTHFFVAGLEKQLYTYQKAKISWQDIFEEANEKARRQALTAVCGDARCVQTPAFRVKSSF